jgi:integration host factor subunit beta
MNRSEIAIELSELYPKLSRREVDTLVKKIFSELAVNIAKGNRVEIRGFGCFSLKSRQPGVIRNPRDGEEFESSDERNVVYFRAGKELKTRVDSGNSASRS